MMDLIAFIVLILPPGTPTPYCPRLRPSIVAVSGRLEARPAHYADCILRDAGEWDSDLNELRRNVWNPPLWHCHRLPDHDACQFRRSMALACKNYAEKIAPLLPAAEEERVVAWHGYFNYSADAYWHMTEAMNPAASSYARRFHLAALRRLIGEAAFARGDWPDYSW